MPVTKPVPARPVFDDVAPWPGENPQSAAPIGHNKPPLEEIIPAEFRALLTRDKADFLEVLERNVAAADRATATDDETLGKCADLVGNFRKIINHINAIHKEAKEPHLLAGRLVDAEKNSLLESVNAAKAKVEQIGNAFVAKREAERKAERDRIAAEERAAADRAAEAERQREEAEARAREAEQNAANKRELNKARRHADKAAELAQQEQERAALLAVAAPNNQPVRSDTGSTVSGKQEWKSEVTDYAAAFDAVSDNPKVREAIDKAVAGLVRAGKRELPGCRIWPVAKANFR